MSQIKESFFQEGESPTFIKFLHSFLKSHKSEILFQISISEKKNQE